MDGEKKPNNILRRERQLQGWSQQKIAELAGTSEDVVSRWERGERKPSPFFQEKLCILYGKNAEELGFSELHLDQSFPVSACSAHRHPWHKPGGRVALIGETNEFLIPSEIRCSPS